MNENIMENTRADNIFENMGYKVKYQGMIGGETEIIYKLIKDEYNKIKKITFYHPEGRIEIDTKKYTSNGIEECNAFLRINELKAINEKCKELGWLD